LSARALGPLCLGYLGLHEAALRPDVSIVGNEEALAATFAKKPLYQSDHY
ncbi:MAG: hypothetical protein GX558_08835, partial [Clostridiales bacterium]|nr:hypothetical protein [Clostridiales bacterium]